VEVVVVKPLRKIIEAARVAILLERAWVLVSKKKYAEANLCFAKIDAITTRLWATAQIMKAYTKYLVSEYNEAALLFDIAWEKVDQEIVYNNEEKSYLKAYIARPAKITADFIKLTEKPAFQYRNVIDIDVNAIDLRKIRRRLKREFPNRDHVDWDFK
jgi:hypothetical protein